jgi:pyruvate-formate lyase-activating enzyme
VNVVEKSALPSEAVELLLTDGFACDVAAENAVLIEKVGAVRVPAVADTFELVSAAALAIVIRSVLPPELYVVGYPLFVRTVATADPAASKRVSSEVLELVPD